MASKSQLKKQAQAAAAAAARMEADDMGMPQMPVMPDPRVKYLWSPDGMLNIIHRNVILTL